MDWPLLHGVCCISTYLRKIIALSLLSLSFVTLGLNGNWWGYIKVNDVASFLAPLKLKPEDVRI